MEFKKVSDFKYIITEGVDELINQTYDIMKSISTNENISLSSYATFVNDHLFHSIITRLVSKEFFSKHVIANDIFMVNIELTVNNRPMYISLGKIEDIHDNNNNKKYVDMIFIK